MSSIFPLSLTKLWDNNLDPILSLEEENEWNDKFLFEPLMGKRGLYQVVLVMSSSQGFISMNGWLYVVWWWQPVSRHDWFLEWQVRTSHHSSHQAMERNPQYSGAGGTQSVWRGTLKRTWDTFRSLWLRRRRTGWVLWVPGRPSPSPRSYCCHRRSHILPSTARWDPNAVNCTYLNSKNKTFGRE